MHIGDRVRLLRGKEEGVILRFIDAQLVEVAIDGDFPVPVLRREVVVVSSDEARVFGNEPTAAPKARRDGRAARESAPAASVRAVRGLFLAFVPLNDQALQVHLVNNTDLDVPFTLGHERNGQYTGLRTGLLATRSALLVDSVSLQQFEKWPAYVVQALLHPQGAHTLLDPFRRKLRFRANTFFQHKGEAPILKQIAYLFQLDPEAAPTIDPGKLVEQMFEAKSTAPAAVPSRAPGEIVSEVDLHIEALTDDYQKLDNAEMLNMQLSAFEKTFDQAVAAGLDEITFIHGVGAGKLRQALHRRLSQHPHVAHYRDARRDKFGAGATTVKIK